MSASSSTAASNAVRTPPRSSSQNKSEHPKMKAGDILGLLKQTYAEWSEDKAPRLGAAFAFYAISSIAPLLIVLIGIAGLVFGEEAARGQIEQQIQSTVGPEAAKSIQEMIANAGEKKSSGIWASVIGIGTLLLSASALFGQLQDSLNTIWEVTPKPGQGIMAVIRQRFLSFSMILGVGFILLISLVISAGIAAFGHFMNDALPMPEWVMHVLNMVISFLIVTLLFAMIFKVLPDAEVQWRDVWVGAALTSVLFAVGKFALGLYLGKSGASSAYGAAGSLVLILLWVYYAAQIMFFGAEFTQVYANKFGSKVKPSPHAVRVTDEMRANQGMPRTADVQAASEAADMPGNVPSVEIWKPGQQAATTHKAKKAGHVGPVDGRDVDYLRAALVAFAATIFFFRKRGDDEKHS